MGDSGRECLPSFQHKYRIGTNETAIFCVRLRQLSTFESPFINKRGGAYEQETVRDDWSK